MAKSPSKYKDRVLAWSVFSKGRRLGDQYELTSASVYTALDRIGCATLRFNAGDMDKQLFGETDSDLFKPGTPIRLDAGDAGRETTLFEGMILDVGIRIGGGARSQMVLECRDCAYPATQVRSTRIFRKKKDGEMIKAVLSAYGDVSAEATDAEYPEAVQYDCTDWDFARSRADACGLFLLTQGRKIQAVKPEVSASAVLTVTYGVDLIDFDAALSCGDQFAGYEAGAWDPAQQKAIRSSASSPSLNKQGDLQPSSISLPGKQFLQTDAAAGERELKLWTGSMALRAGLSRYQGTMRFYGSPEVVPGCLVELKGLGKRFDGNAFIGSVRHVLENNEWITEAGLGLAAGNVTAQPDAGSLRAGGLLPGAGGVHTGLVKQLEGDPGKLCRIQVEFPWMNTPEKTLWARISSLYAHNDSGILFLPEKGDEVLVCFVNDDPRDPVVIGSLYGPKHKPPFEYADKNPDKGIVTPSGLKVLFDDEKKSVKILTPGKNMLFIDDDGKSIELSDQNRNKIVLSKSGIEIVSGKDLTIKAQGNVTLKAGAKAEVAATQDLALKGLNIKAEAQVGAVVKGSATAELSASGQTVVKGAIVMIN